MVSVIIGNKGSGKTKRLIDLVNQAVEGTNGNVVCIEKGAKLTYDINYKARLIDTDHYGINGFDAFFGFISGICAGNYDVTDILIDATFKIGGRDYEACANFLAKLENLSKISDTKFVLTLSCDESELPARIFDSCVRA